MSEASSGDGSKLPADLHVNISPHVERDRRWQIQLYKDEYKGQVRQLVRDTLADDFGVNFDPPDVDDIPGIYQSDNGNFWLALKGGDVVGAIALRDFGEKRGMLKRFYVRRDQRGRDQQGRGIGEDLFSELLTFAKEKKYREIYLTTTPETEAAQKVFRRHGFTQIPDLPEDIPDFGDPIFYRLDMDRPHEEE